MVRFAEDETLASFTTSKLKKCLRRKEAGLYIGADVDIPYGDRKCDGVIVFCKSKSLQIPLGGRFIL